MPESDAQTLTRSGGIGGIGQFPSLELPTRDGAVFRSWDCRSRSHLVLMYLGDLDPQGGVVSPEVYRALRAENAELIIIVRDPFGVEGCDGPGIIACDPAGAMGAKLGVLGPELLVANKHATVYWRETFGATGPNISEVLSWLGYINIIEPECGCCAPVWPSEGS